MKSATKKFEGIKSQIQHYLFSIDDPECHPDIREDFIIFSARPFDLKFLMAKLNGMSTARYWTGNDSWKYKNIWHYRLRARVTNWFVDKHYFIAEHLKVRDLKGITRLYKSQLEYTTTERRFTALYYDVEMTFKNRYGLDLIEKLKDDFPQIIWLGIKPGIYELHQMIFFLQNANLLVRPTRWDGEPLMVREAVYFGLPVISTFSTMKDVIKCDPDNYDHLKNEVEKIYDKWQSDQAAERRNKSLGRSRAKKAIKND